MKKILNFILIVMLILSMAMLVSCDKPIDPDEKNWTGFYSVTE